MKTSELNKAIKSAKVVFVQVIATRDDVYHMQVTKTQAFEMVKTMNDNSVMGYIDLNNGEIILSND